MESEWNGIHADVGIKFWSSTPKNKQKKVKWQLKSPRNTWEVPEVHFIEMKNRGNLIKFPKKKIWVSLKNRFTWLLLINRNPGILIMCKYFDGTHSAVNLKHKRIKQACLKLGVIIFMVSGIHLYIGIERRAFWKVTKKINVLWQ